MRLRRSSSGPLLTPAPGCSFIPSLWMWEPGGGGADPGPDPFDPDDGGVERSGPGGSRKERRSSGSTSPN
jgi:hypothetical protein